MKTTLLVFLLLGLGCVGCWAESDAKATRKYFRKEVIEEGIPVPVDEIGKAESASIDSKPVRNYVYFNVAYKPTGEVWTMTKYLKGKMQYMYAFGYDASGEVSFVTMLRPVPGGMEKSSFYQKRGKGAAKGSAATAP